MTPLVTLAWVWPSVSHGEDATMSSHVLSDTSLVLWFSWTRDLVCLAGPRFGVRGEQWGLAGGWILLLVCPVSFCIFAVKGVVSSLGGGGPGGLGALSTSVCEAAGGVWGCKWHCYVP